MSTTFSVISLGIGAEIDTTEGNTSVENEALLVGLTFGSAGSPLLGNIETLAPVGSPGTEYSGDNIAANETYDVGGTTYTHDALGSYSATVTFSDGSTEVVDVILAQTTTGELFLVPHVAGDEAAQAVLDSKPIQSLTLDSANGTVTADMTADRLDAQLQTLAVEGSSGDDDMSRGYIDPGDDLIDAVDNLILAGDGNDTIEGSGGSDTIDGGAGADLIDGDFAGYELGTLNVTNTDNLDDGSDTETLNIRAAELTTLPNGDLIMITSERSNVDDGVASYRIDNDPDSGTYGQIVGGQIDRVTASGSGAGFDEIEDMETITLSNGDTYLYTADYGSDAIGITQINSDGTLTPQTSLTSTDFQEITALSMAEVGGQPYLLAINGGTADNLIAYQINTDGTLTQTDVEVDGSGAGENFLNNANANNASLLQSFTNSSDETFVITGGSEDGFALWTLDGSGQLSFQNARGDNQAGSGDTDPQGNDLGRDLISPAGTGLNNIDGGTFAEIDGQTYVFIGGEESDISIFRIDVDTVNGDGTFDLTLVGHVDDEVSYIASMAVMETDTGHVLLIGGETAGLEFHDITVNGDGTVSLSLAHFEGDGGSAELADVEDIDIAGGIVVTASDNDSGVALLDTGLNDPALTGEAGNDSITGGAGDDTITGGDGDDTIDGGDDNDAIYGDENPNKLGNLNLSNTDNLTDGGGTETNLTRAVELVTLSNGDLIMITSERSTSSDGIASYKIDNDPSSATYGQIVGGQIDAETGGESGGGPGYDNIEDLEAITLSNGNTYVFSADHNDEAIGITQVNSDGTLTAQTPLSSSDFAQISELSVVEAGGQPILLALNGGTANNLVAYQINTDGSLTQTDIEVDGSGTGENFLNNGAATASTLLESFTNSSGETFVIAGGVEDGISLWTLNSSGQLTFQNARADDAAGSGDTDPEGNDLGRDLVAPAQTGLLNVDAGTFAEIDGQTYLFVGGADDAVAIFRVDADTVNGDGTFDLTMVGYSDINLSTIQTMEILHTDSGPVLVVGGEQTSIEFHDVTVNGDGTVSLSLADELFDGGSAELQDSEAMDVQDGILVSASDADEGVAIINTGLGAQAATTGGDDSLSGGAGDDTIIAGAGSDTIDGGTGDDSLDGGDDADNFLLSDAFGTDTIIGGEGTTTGTDTDIIDASAMTGGVSVSMSDTEDGTITSGADTITYSQIEQFVLTDQDDTVDGSAATGGVSIDGGAGADLIAGGSGADTIIGGADADTITIGDGFGNDTLTGGEAITSGTDTDSIDLSGVTTGGVTVTYSDAEDGTVTDGTDTISFAEFEAMTLTDQADSVDGTLDTGGLNIAAGAGADTVVGGSGDDSFDGGAGDDSLTGGGGDDVFVVSSGHDTISDFNTGNTGTLNDGDPTNNDQIDLSAYYDHLFELWADQADDGILNQSNTLDTQGNAVNYLDNTQFGAGSSLTFTGATSGPAFFNAENTGVVCFAKGTPILTADGEVPVEKLELGTLVKTVDNGFRPIRWIGHNVVDGTGKHAPIRIDAGVLNNHSPLVVSPQHRVLVNSKIANRMTGTNEILVAAKHLLSMPGVERQKVDKVEYYHFLFDRHELVCSAGAISESLYTGAEALRSLDEEALEEIFDIFPELANRRDTCDLARPCVIGRVGRRLVFRHTKNAVELV